MERSDGSAEPAERFDPEPDERPQEGRPQKPSRRHHLPILVLVLMGSRVCPKLDHLEDMVMDLTSLDRGRSTEATSERLDADSNGLHVLRQQMSYLR